MYNSDNSFLTKDIEMQRYTCNGKNTEAKNVKEDSSRGDKEEYYTAFFYGTSLTNYTSDNNKCITGADSFTPFRMVELCTGTNHNNCGPTAAMNMCGYYYSLGKTNMYTNSSVSDTYDALVIAVGFPPNGSGNTSYSNLKNGLKNYIQGRSYAVSVNGYLFNTWNNFKNDFDANKPNLNFIEGYKYENNTWNVAGHFVVGIGYRILNDGTRYVRIYDGWKASSNRFIHFGSDTLVTFKGASVVVS